ncbi:MAG: type I DNA topoisomerase [Flavobacteriales bacterium]|nr:type I DNA topoisomerase [Flavobacteriales bacterium]
MAKNLVIVESPAKAKTIEKYLGKDFIVKSSYGHVRDLPSKGLSIDIENDFEPTYEISPDKKKVIDELSKLAKEAEIIWLATDEDREGEAISWHLEEALKLDREKTKRITFNEITKTAIQRAIDSPREIDRKLVDAQQARRVLDRLVGFELSPVLWKKVKPSLSAGRVQSVSVRLIVEREKEIMDFESTSSFRLVALFDIDGSELKAELPARFSEVEEARKFLSDCIEAEFSVADLEVKPGKRTPASPFTTSTLQQEASRKLGYPVGLTMSKAQKLYEAGHITYMRTDSVNLSDQAIGQSKEVITSKYGAEFSQPRKYTTKNKGAQEAHEAIRPTDIGVNSVSDSDLDKLYQLIWKRTIASQMADAQLEKTNIKIDISSRPEQLNASGEVIKFEGFLKVYLEGKDDEDDEEKKGVLPPVQVGQSLKLTEFTAKERFTKHPPRYTEASLVKKLEELGIGRPSTYAPTISTIQKRGYVEKDSRDGTETPHRKIVLKDGGIEESTHPEVIGTERNKLFPTDIGIVVNDFLVDNFEDVLNYNFTASVEQKFDDIANGQLQWQDMIKEFYRPFHKDIENTLEHSERATGERVLGKDPVSGKEVIARIGRYGPMVQIGRVEDEEKPRFASLRKEQSIQTLTFEEAMKLFELPRTLGNSGEDDVVAAIGRFGPYVRVGKTFVSIPKDAEYDAYTIELPQALELYQAKLEADKNKFIKTFPEDESIQVLNGRYGPYIKAGKKNVRIPKDVKPEDLTLEECKKLAEAAPAKRSRSRKK